MKQSMKGLAPEWYTLASEKGEPDPVQFYLKPLDGFGGMDITMLQLGARQTGERADAALAGSEVMKTAFRLGVKDWRNIQDADNPGKELEFSRRAMACIPSEWIMEVGARVLEISKLGEVRSKNSDSPSSSPATAETSPVSAEDAIAPTDGGETPG